MVNLFRSGAVGFIDWLGLFVSLLKDLSQAARLCGVAVGVGVGVTVGVGWCGNGSGCRSGSNESEAHAEIFYGPFYGRARFYSKIAQLCATHCESGMTNYLESARYAKQ